MIIIIVLIIVISSPRHVPGNHHCHLHCIHDSCHRHHPASYSNRLGIFPSKNIIYIGVRFRISLQSVSFSASLVFLLSPPQRESWRLCKSFFSFLTIWQSFQGKSVLSDARAKIFFQSPFLSKTGDKLPGLYYLLNIDRCIILGQRNPTFFLISQKISLTVI